MPKRVAPTAPPAPTTTTSTTSAGRTPQPPPVEQAPPPPPRVEQAPPAARAIPTSHFEDESPKRQKHPPWKSSRNEHGLMYLMILFLAHREQAGYMSGNDTVDSLTPKFVQHLHSQNITYQCSKSNFGIHLAAARRLGWRVLDVMDQLNLDKDNLSDADLDRIWSNAAVIEDVHATELQHERNTILRLILTVNWGPEHAGRQRKDKRQRNHDDDAASVGGDSNRPAPPRAKVARVPDPARHQEEPFRPQDALMQAFVASTTRSLEALDKSMKTIEGKFGALEKSLEPIKRRLTKLELRQELARAESVSSQSIEEEVD